MSEQVRVPMIEHKKIVGQSLRLSSDAATCLAVELM